MIDETLSTMSRQICGINKMPMKVNQMPRSTQGDDDHYSMQTTQQNSPTSATKDKKKNK